MLRESINTIGESYQFGAITGIAEDHSSIPMSRPLAEFAEAVVSRDAAGCARLRDQIAKALGEAAMVDAAAVVAAFHGFVRIADASGIPVDDARAEATVDLRAEIGIDAYQDAGYGWLRPRLAPKPEPFRKRGEAEPL